MRLIYCLMFLILVGCDQKSRTYDLAIINAVIFDGTSYHETHQTIVMNHHKIISVSPSKASDSQNNAFKQIIDAAGRFVMPGIIEGHGHLLSYGEGLSNIELGQYMSWDDIIEAVAEQASTLPPGTWIEGRGWHQEKWNTIPQDAVQGYPVHAEFSRQIPDHPVFLEHASGHAAFANDKAMEVIGISIETKAPNGGRILKDATGRLTGIFEENALELIEDFVDQTKNLKDVWEKALKRAGESCLAQGITSFQDAGSKIEEIKWLQSKADQHKLPLRLYVMAYDSIHLIRKDLADLRLINEGDSFLTCRAVKGYFDGALGSRGAWLLKEYEDQPGYFGQKTSELNKLNKYAVLCNELDFQFCVHAIGDRANRETLSLFENNLNQKSDNRWRIEHAQHIDPSDHARFADLNVIASMQPIHCTSDAPFVVARLGEHRAKTGAYVWRSLLDHKAQLAIGTDVPVESLNPFENIYSALTRKHKINSPSFFEEQSFNRLEILNLYTAGNAYAAFEESFKGKIELGYVADICILDKNLISCEANEIPETKVLFTILNGKVVYQNSIPK